MLKAKKKITKKELKEDALVSSYTKFLVFYEEKKKLIGYVALGVVILAVLLVAYINNRNSNNEKAATALGKIFTFYDAGANDVKQYEIAINGMPERSVMGLKSIVDNYGSTNSGELAKLYLGNAYFATGKLDDAMKMFEDFSSNDPILQAAATAGEASCFESKGNYEQAASLYEKAAGLQTIETPEYLQSSARCYGLKGDKPKALALCLRIKKEFPKSTQARDIDRYIAQYTS